MLIIRRFLSFNHFILFLQQRGMLRTFQIINLLRQLEHLLLIGLTKFLHVSFGETRLSNAFDRLLRLLDEAANLSPSKKLLSAEYPLVHVIIVFRVVVNLVHRPAIFKVLLVVVFLAGVNTLFFLG